jgi:hypothetical protein
VTEPGGSEKTDFDFIRRSFGGEGDDFRNTPVQMATLLNTQVNLWYHCSSFLDNEPAETVP